MLKKCLCVILVVLSVWSLMVPVNAEKVSAFISEEDKQSIVEILVDIEPQKNMWGLENINFSNLEIANPIHTYNFVNGSLIDGGVIYPLILEEDIVLFAIQDNGIFQISNGLIDQINKAIDAETPFALFYDNESVYLYADNDIRLLKKSAQRIHTRSQLCESTKLSTEKIKTTNLLRKVSLDYETKAQQNIQRASVNYSCGISYVTQNPYDNLCWAATVASIANYKNNTSLTAARVARNYYGDTLFDRPIDRDELVLIIRTYGLPYYRFANTGSMENVIYQSILADYPVGGVFDVLQGNYHATVIFGINIMAGRIQVMDPEFGMTTATYSSAGKYTYRSNINNDTLELYGVCYDTGK